MCIHWRLGSLYVSTQPDHSLRYVMCILCIVKDMRLLHATTEGWSDRMDVQADLNEHVNCRICCAHAQMIWTVINANHEDPDQTPGSVASDLGFSVCQCPFHGTLDTNRLSRNIWWCLIWVYTICQSPFYGTLTIIQPAQIPIQC